jgi:beta-lactam-binding protein with PASTA domain
MPSIFVISPVADSVKCPPGGSAEHAFTVTNTTDSSRPVGTQVLVDGAAEAKWFTVQGEPERTLGAHTTNQFTVRCTVPPNTAPGKYTFRLMVFSAEKGRSGEDFTEGPTVAVEVPAAKQASKPAPKPFPWWIAAVAAAVLLLVVGGLTWWLATRPPKVPELVGLTLEQATKSIGEAKFKVGKISEETTGQKPGGTVLRQQPVAGIRAEKQSAVDLSVEATLLQVPDLSGKGLDDAKGLLQSKGFKLGDVRHEFTGRAGAGTVIGQSPKAGGNVPPGTTVALTVELGPVVAPSVSGQTLAEAREMLTQLGLKVGQVDERRTGGTPGIVLSQRPPAGQSVPPNSAIALVVEAKPIPTGMEIDTDRMGSDYVVFDLASPDPAPCQSRCAGDPQCRAWTYVKPGVQGAQARCYLKNPVPTASHNTCCISGVKEGAAAGLAAPQQISPADGAVFDTFPRQTTVQWAPVPGAANYSVEVDCMHCCATGKWCTDVGKTYQVKDGLKSPSYTFSFVGAQPGRWRVWVVDSSGTAGPKTPWREFRYTR